MYRAAPSSSGTPASTILWLNTSVTRFGVLTTLAVVLGGGADAAVAVDVPIRARWGFPLGPRYSLGPQSDGLSSTLQDPPFGCGKFFVGECAVPVKCRQAFQLIDVALPGRGRSVIITQGHLCLKTGLSCDYRR